MIDPAHYGLIELLLFGAIAIGLGVWQLISVNRDIARRKRGEEDRRD